MSLIFFDAQDVKLLFEMKDIERQQSGERKGCQLYARYRTRLPPGSSVNWSRTRLRRSATVLY